MFCKTCGTQLDPNMRFCKKCGSPVAVASDTPPAYTVVEPMSDAPVEQPYAATMPQQPYVAATPQSRPVDKRALWIGIAVVVLLLAGGYYWYSRAAVERKMNDAAAKGNLLKPPGESAYDYYRKLKEQGMSDSTRKQLEAKLLPQVMARPRQMLTDLATPANRSEATLADWQDAQTLTDWAAEMQPNDKAIAARASYCAGRVAYLSNRKDDAVTFWKRASEQDATWAMPLNGLGLIYNERKNYQMARSFLFEAIRREPQFALPYNNLGSSYLGEKNDAQAEGYYRQAVERAPQWPRPHAWLADIAVRRKNYPQAVEELEAVLNLDPSGASGIDVNRIRQQLEQARRGAASSAGTDGFSYNDVRGTIGTIKILFSFSVGGARVTGSIRYGDHTDRTRLEGNMDGGGFYRLSEFAPDGKLVGSLVFKGYPTNDGMAIYSGTWTNADGQRKLPFKLDPLGD